MGKPERQGKGSCSLTPQVLFTVSFCCHSVLISRKLAKSGVVMFESPFISALLDMCRLHVCWSLNKSLTICGQIGNTYKQLMLFSFLKSYRERAKGRQGSFKILLTSQSINLEPSCMHINQKRGALQADAPKHGPDDRGVCDVVCCTLLFNIIPFVIFMY